MFSLTIASWGHAAATIDPATDHLAGARGDGRQHAELRRCQQHLSSVAGQRVSGRVQHQVGRGGRAVTTRPRLASASTRADQLLHVEGLGQVVVGAGAEAGKPLVHRAQCGQEDHRRRLARRPQRLADVAPVGVRAARCRARSRRASRPRRTAAAPRRRRGRSSPGDRSGVRASETTRRIAGSSSHSPMCTMGRPPRSLRELPLLDPV